MRTIYIKFWSPEELGIPKTTDAEIIKACFRVYKLENEFQALDMYANTRCTWSTLKDDSMSVKDIKNWIKKAYKHIKESDYEWLELNFT